MTRLTGSQRRFIVCWAAIVLIALARPLKLEGAALTALVILCLGYMGQGAAKEAYGHRREEEGE